MMTDYKTRVAEIDAEYRRKVRKSNFMELCGIVLTSFGIAVVCLSLGLLH
jgi:hypothetical protein